MSTSGTFTPGGGAAAQLAEEWASEFDVLCNERAVLYPYVKQLGTPHKKFHMPQIDNIDTALLSETATPDLTFQVNTETEFTATARSRVTPIQLSRPALVRMASDPTDDYRTVCEKSIVSAIDADLLALASALTTNVVGDPAQNLDYGIFADAHQKLASGGLGYFEPGSGTPALLVLATTQDDDLISITNITQAQIRGDRENPIPKGWVAHALGIDIVESTNVQVTAGTTANNILLIPRAMGIGFNQTPLPIIENYQIWKRIILWADYAYGTIRQRYAVLVKTTSA